MALDKTLPNETVHQILSYLDDVVDMIHLSMTCKTLQAAIDPVLAKVMRVFRVGPQVGISKRLQDEVHRPIPTLDVEPEPIVDDNDSAFRYLESLCVYPRLRRFMRFAAINGATPSLSDVAHGEDMWSLPPDMIVALQRAWKSTGLRALSLHAQISSYNELLEAARTISIATFVLFLCPNIQVIEFGPQYLPTDVRWTHELLSVPDHLAFRNLRVVSITPILNQDHLAAISTLIKVASLEKLYFRAFEIDPPCRCLLSCSCFEFKCEQSAEIIPMVIAGLCSQGWSVNIYGIIVNE